MAESSGRMLPQISESTEFFWKSGEDGTLRFQRCSSCGELRHPPCPSAAYCHSTDWAPSAVSGKGVVAGFTINEHTWMPSFPPPYVIAIVAIEEDDRVRLTTNIVNCDPTDVFVGMKVQVLFEHDDDVWLPVFEPTGDPRRVRSRRRIRRSTTSAPCRRTPTSSRTMSPSPASACRRSDAASCSIRSC